MVARGPSAPLPEPISLAPPLDWDEAQAYFETLEGMRVAVADGVVIGPTYAGCGLTIWPGETAVFPLQVSRDDTTDLGPVLSVLHTSDVDCGTFPQLKVGDEISGAVGPLTYQFDWFRLVHQEANDLHITAAPWPPLPPPPVVEPTQISIASFNLENHFDNFDDTGTEAEPKPSTEQIRQRQEKLAYALGVTLGCPTLVGVQEVENEALLWGLAEAAATYCPFTYDVTHLDSPDVRGIDVALLSQPDRVVVVEAALQPACTPLETGIIDPELTCPAGQSPLFSRPPLRVDAQVDQRPFTLYINHFKSKRGGALETTPRRLAQARHVHALVQRQLETETEPAIVILGDFNDYDQSAPLLALQENGVLFNALTAVPAADRYSFIFNGVGQLIDGIFLSPSLAEQVAAVTIQHTNAAYPDALQADLSPANLPYRATDHDLPLVVLNWPKVELPTLTPAPAKEVTRSQEATPTAPPPFIHHDTRCCYSHCPRTDSGVGMVTLVAFLGGWWFVWLLVWETVNLGVYWEQRNEESAREY